MQLPNDPRTALEATNPIEISRATCPDVKCSLDLPELLSIPRLHPPDHTLHVLKEHVVMRGLGVTTREYWEAHASSSGSGATVGSMAVQLHQAVT